jgi:hypothetical protein
MAVRCERFTKRVAGAAPRGILMTRAASLPGLLSVCGQCLRRFGNGNRHHSADRRSDSPQDLKIHLIFSVERSERNINS